MLHLENVFKKYHVRNQAVQAVDGVSLQVAAREFVAVRGPSGCGKSTLLLMAGGLLKPDSGRVLIDQADPYAMPPDRRAEFRARKVGFVFQQFHLVPYLTVLENILAPELAIGHPATTTSDSSPAAGVAEDAAQRAVQLLDRFGLADRQHHVPEKLSSGERQRTALARALLNQPELLLADEPTGNLDHANADLVLNCLADFAAAGGSVLLVTHDDRAVAHAGSIVNLEHGKVVEPVSV